MTKVDWSNNLSVFDYQYRVDNEEFIRRLGGLADFVVGKKVAEIGTGHGALAICMAELGAKSVVGFEIFEKFVNFSNDNLARFSHIRDKVEFRCREFGFDGESFDVVVSKDTFEHVSNLRELMLTIKSRLSVGGVLVVGFSPLYYSPNGDHKRFLGNFSFPWACALIPEAMLLKLASWNHGRRIKSAFDVGLNKVTPAEFRELIVEQGWVIKRIRYNAGGTYALKIMNRIRKIPFLEKYFTVSIYAVLERGAVS